MAAEAVIGRIGLHWKAAERATPVTSELKLNPILLFTRYDVLDLARAYRDNLWFRRKSYSPLEEARLSGILEVQKVALEAMGQHHIVRMDGQMVKSAARMKEDELTAEIRSFSERDVRRLERVYRDSKSFVVGHKLEDREWTKIAPEEMKVYARMREAGRILDSLGQRDLVIAINNSFIPPSERIDWAKNRSTGVGEIM